MTDEHERIWLEPQCCVDPGEGRAWCQDDVWPIGDCDSHAPGVEFIRADLHAAAIEAARREGWCAGYDAGHNEAAAVIRAIRALTPPEPAP